MDAKPLLEPGIHDFNLGDFDNHFLSDFPYSVTRGPLIAGLMSFVGHLSDIGVPIELWIDGSFTTEKTDPNDIDLVLFSPPDALNALTEEKKKMFQILTDRETSHEKFGCDVLFCPADNNNMRSYWRGWYGFDRGENPKGIARVMVNT